MTPYYSDEWVTIWHGDARDVPLPTVDAILTDPPYARSELPLWSLLATVATGYLRPAGWLVAYSGQAHLPEVMARLAVDGLTYRWTLAASYEGGGQIARIGDQTVLTEWKPVLAYRRQPFGSARGPAGRFVAGGRTGFRDLLRRGGREKDDHPWAQPLAEASEIVTRFTEPAGLVLDPFAGSGTFLAAAKSMGRRSIGVELREDQCENAANRCRQEVLGLSVTEVLEAP